MDRVSFSLAMMYGGLNDSVLPQSTGWLRLLSRLRRALDERNKLPLGATPATENIYRALHKHFSGADLFLIPDSVQHEAQLSQEINQLSQAGLICAHTCVTNIAEVVRASSSHAVVLFDPGIFRTQLFDIRQTYFERPVPITCIHHSFSYRKMLEEIFLPLLMSETLPCDSIICSSVAARGAISNILEQMSASLSDRGATYNGRLDIVPFGVDTTKFYPINQKLCRRKFDLPLDSKIFLYFGRLSASDKADLLPLVLAFTSVREAVPNLRPLLVIAGNPRGSYSDRLKAELRDRNIADSVRFVPHVSDGERPFLYGAADLFLSPADSVQESFGLVILEAMACGVPQVVSDWNGYRDLVVHNDTGLLIPTVWADCDEVIIKEGMLYPEEWQMEHFQLGQSVCIDTKLLYDGLVEIARNSDLRQRMSAASRARAEAFFDWEKIVRRYEQVWEEVSQIAATMPAQSRGRNSYRIPRYFECFRHYATANMEADSLLLWNHSHLGAPVLPYKGLFNKVDPFANWKLNELSEIVRTAEHGIAVSRLLEEAAGCGERAELTRQIMWLLKYGYIRLQPYPPFVAAKSL